MISAQEIRKFEGKLTMTLLWLFQSRKGHLCAWNVLFRIFKIFKERLLTPSDTFILVSIGVGVSFDGTSLSTKQSM